MEISGFELITPNVSIWMLIIIIIINSLFSVPHPSVDEAVADASLSLPFFFLFDLLTGSEFSSSESSKSLTLFGPFRLVDPTSESDDIVLALRRFDLTLKTFIVT